MGQIYLLLAVAIVFYFLGVYEQGRKTKKANNNLNSMYALNDRLISRNLKLLEQLAKLQSKIEISRITKVG